MRSNTACSRPRDPESSAPRLSASVRPRKAMPSSRRNAPRQQRPSRTALTAGRTMVHMPTVRALALPFALAGCSARATTPCADLKSLSLGVARITQAAHRLGGTLTFTTAGAAAQTTTQDLAGEIRNRLVCFTTRTRSRKSIGYTCVLAEVSADGQRMTDIRSTTTWTSPRLIRTKSRTSERHENEQRSHQA